jgi:hypothetical protein
VHVRVLPELAEDTHGSSVPTSTRIELPASRMTLSTNFGQDPLPNVVTISRSPVRAQPMEAVSGARQGAPYLVIIVDGTERGSGNAAVEDTTSPVISLEGVCGVVLLACVMVGPWVQPPKAATIPIADSVHSPTTH